MDQRVQKVVILMNDNVCRPFPLKEMARSVNLSTWRLCHVFKSDTGLTPARYFRGLKIQKAKNLLETTFLSVKEIMAKIAVNDESHFVREFKKAYKLTPAKYRVHHLAKLNEEAATKK